MRTEFDKFAKKLEREHRTEDMTDEEWEEYCFKVLGSERKTLDGTGPDGTPMKTSWSDVIWAFAGLPQTEKGNKNSSWAAYRALAFRFRVSWKAYSRLMRAYESAEVSNPYKEEKMEVLREIVAKRKRTKSEAALQRDISTVMKARPPLIPSRYPNTTRFDGPTRRTSRILLAPSSGTSRTPLTCKNKFCKSFTAIPILDGQLRRLVTAYCFSVI
jgi:hypothetical protein